jgi:bifunctional DNase/RNase
LALALESVESPRPFTYKLATGLLKAAGSRLSEVRITRLMDSVFYAAVIVAGPNGVQEVDSRPSDAVNLALVANAPIRVDHRLLSNASATDSEKFVSYPVATAELAAEAQQRMREMMQEMMQEPARLSGDPFPRASGVIMGKRSTEQPFPHDHQLERLPPPILPPTTGRADCADGGHDQHRHRDGSQRLQGRGERDYRYPRSHGRRESAAGSSPNRKRHSSDHAPAKRQVTRPEELDPQHMAPGLDAADGPLSHAIVTGYRINRNDLAVEVQVQVPKQGLGGGRAFCAGAGEPELDMDRLRMDHLAVRWRDDGEPGRAARPREGCRRPVCRWAAPAARGTEQDDGQHYERMPSRPHHALPDLMICATGPNVLAGTFLQAGRARLLPGGFSRICAKRRWSWQSTVTGSPGSSPRP